MSADTYYRLMQASLIAEIVSLWVLVACLAVMP